MENIVEVTLGEISRRGGGGPEERGRVVSHFLTGNTFICCFNVFYDHWSGREGGRTSCEDEFACCAMLASLLFLANQGANVRYICLISFRVKCAPVYDVCRASPHFSPLAMEITLILHLHLKDGDYDYTMPVYSAAEALGKRRFMPAGMGYVRFESDHKKQVPVRDDKETSAELSLKYGDQSFRFMSGGRRTKKTGDIVSFESLELTLDSLGVPRYVTPTQLARDLFGASVSRFFDAVNGAHEHRARKRKAEEDLVRIAKVRRLLDEEEEEAKEALQRATAHVAHNEEALRKECAVPGK